MSVPSKTFVPHFKAEGRGGGGGRNANFNVLLAVGGSPSKPIPRPFMAMTTAPLLPLITSLQNSSWFGLGSEVGPKGYSCSD